MTEATGDFGPEWVERTRAAVMFGVGIRQFDERHRKLAPADGVRKVKAKIFFNFPVLLAAFVAAELAKAAPKDASGDPLLAGGDSPNLEEYRKHKARIAKVEADEAEGMSVRVAKIRPGMLGAMALIRRAGERLERSHGADAARVLTEAVDEAIQSVGKMFDDATGNTIPAGDVGSGQANTPADDA